MSRTLVVLGVLVLFGGSLVACEKLPPERVIIYQIATRGQITADAVEFARHVASTLADPRGWSAGGAIEFREVPDHAQFTVVLAEASTVPSFSKACSSQWSCRAGRYVVINQDRWQGATSTWSYDLDSYRDYVVNHEVGHWMGLSHRSCSGGFWDRAPVMAQQSKGGPAKGACRFNVWPTPDEIAGASGIRGVAARYSGVPNPDDPFGRLDQVEVERNEQGKPVKVRVLGWAADGDTQAPLGALIMVDGKLADLVLADKERPDIAGAVPYLGVKHGYDAAVEVDPSSEVVCVSAIGGGPGLPFVQLGCQVVK